MHGDPGPVLVLARVNYRGVNYSVQSMHYEHNNQTSWAVPVKSWDTLFLLLFVN